MCAGFGRIGQIVGPIRVGWRNPFTALDINPEHVETVRRFGMKVYFGDASPLDLLIGAKTVGFPPADFGGAHRSSARAMGKL